MTPYLELKNIHKKFPGVYALKNVSISIKAGEIHALVGENGAGKSTLIKVMAGYHAPTQGNCYIEGKEVHITNPTAAIALGIGVVYQELNVVDSLNVAENIFFGRLPQNRWGQVKWKQLYEDTKKILDRLGLSIEPNRKVGYLSTAQKQMVEIARCISMNPKVIIMDEPTSSLAPTEIKNILAIAEKLKEQDVGILYISHKLDEVFAISDRITVLRDGELIQSMETKNTNEQEIISLMVGRKLDEMFKRTSSAQEETALEVKGLSTYQLKDLSFYVKKGEIIGFSGLMGAGRTELAKAVYGMDKREGGSIKLYGEEIPAGNMAKSVKMGMGFIPESRKEEGIFPNLNVMKNVSISSLEDCSKIGIIQRKKEESITETLKDNLRIKTPNMRQLIVNLSGGNQQKAIIARWLQKENLKVLLVDEPTRGIDVGAKDEIYHLLGELAKSGLAIIVMSSEMQEILNLCDRIYVMRVGKITNEFTSAEATQQKLLKSAI